MQAEQMHDSNVARDVLMIRQKITWLITTGRKGCQKTKFYFILFYYMLIYLQTISLVRVQFLLHVLHYFWVSKCDQVLVIMRKF